MIIVLVIISLSILILAHELGHFLTAKLFNARVDEFGLGFPPRIFSKKVGETIYSVNAVPFGGFVKIHGEDGEDLEARERSFGGKTILKKSIIILAGVGMNVVFGWFVLSGVFMIGAPEHLVVSDVAPESPAALAGLKSGDLISKITFEGSILSDPIESGAFIEFVKNTPGGTFAVDLKRGRDVVSVVLSGRENPPAGQGSLGIGLVEIGFERMSFFAAAAKGFLATGEMLFLIAKSFGELFTRAFYDISVFQSISGPVGIVAVAASASSLGLVYLMQLMALISLNLAVLNLIPFPALDGGRFLFLLIEKIKGSPMSRKFQVAVNGVGFALLIALMVIVTVQDIGKL